MTLDDLWIQDIVMVELQGSASANRKTMKVVSQNPTENQPLVFQGAKLSLKREADLVVLYNQR